MRRGITFSIIRVSKCGSMNGFTLIQSGNNFKIVFLPWLGRHEIQNAECFSG